MQKPLPQSWFNRDTCTVARELLGKDLVRVWRGKAYRSMITEVEAYDGPEDKASHASKGETPRTQVMFGPPGHWYVYLVYGMHQMLNVVTGANGYPAAVLIRGVKEVPGPGRLTKAWHISRAQNAKPASKETGLWIEDVGRKISSSQIEATPRIGVDYAGEWVQKPYRFLLKDI